MITILPMKDALRKQQILAGYPAISGKADVIVMCEKEAEFGTAVLAVDGAILKIFDITVNGQDLTALDGMGNLVADSLMRSAASYGENFGANRIEAYVPALSGFLEAKGFTPEDGCMATPMTTIVHRTNPHG